MEKENEDVSDNLNDVLDKALYEIFSKSFLEFYFKWKIINNERIKWVPDDEELKDIKFFLSWITYEDKDDLPNRELVQIVLMDKEIPDLERKMFKFFTLITEEFGVSPRQTVIKL